MEEELTEDVLGHGPKLNSNTGNLCEIRWGTVLKEGGVGDLSRSPFTLVVWVGDFGDSPFTLVLWVSDLGGGPWSTSGTIFTFRVGDHGWDPISILLVLSVSCATENLGRPLTSHSSGFSASGSGMVSGSFSSQSSGLVAEASTIINGASSSQSEGCCQYNYA